MSFLLLIILLTHPTALDPPNCQNIHPDYIICFRKKENKAICQVSPQIECNGQRSWSSNIDVPRNQCVVYFLSCYLTYSNLQLFYFNFFGSFDTLLNFGLSRFIFPLLFFCFLHSTLIYSLCSWCKRRRSLLSGIYWLGPDQDDLPRRIRSMVYSRYYSIMHWTLLSSRWPRMELNGMEIVSLVESILIRNHSTLDLASFFLLLSKQRCFIFFP